MRVTSAKLFVSTKLVPVIVMVLVDDPEIDTVDDDKLAMVGESVSLM